MTTPQVPAAPAGNTGTINIPPISMPLCTRVWAKSPFTDAKAKLVQGEAVLWQFDQPHPFVSTHKVVRMYVVPGGAVEIFSTDGGTTGLRHTIPWHDVQFIEEVMDAPTFVEEMQAAEEEDEEDEEDEEEEEDPKPGELPTGGHDIGPPLVPVTSNGGSS